MSVTTAAKKAPAERTLNDIVCYILCSSCKTGLRRAKIRVRCAECRREPIILADTQHFPPTWLELKKMEFRGWCPDDLGARGRGKGCGYGKLAQFFMKCSYFNEKTQERCDSADILYLDQVKDPPGGTWSTGCVACQKKTGAMVVFDNCECMLCAFPGKEGEKSCFAMYCKHVIETGFVSLVPDERTGYISFGCPSYFQGGKHARSLVRDVHHLKLAGPEIYGSYKEIAASRVTDTTCPWCLCGLVKMQWTEYGEEPHRIICPNSACKKGFCSGRECGAKWPEGTTHKCDTRDSDFVREIARACPTPDCRQLHVHYKQHDCHHIGMKGGCPGCGVHFCYLCGRIRHECAALCSHSNDCDCPLTCDETCTKCPECPGCKEFGGQCPTHKACRKYCSCALSAPAALQGTSAPGSVAVPVETTTGSGTVKATNMGTTKKEDAVVGTQPPPAANPKVDRIAAADFSTKPPTPAPPTTSLTLPAPNLLTMLTDTPAAPPAHGAVSQRRGPTQPPVQLEPPEGKSQRHGGKPTPDQKQQDDAYRRRVAAPQGLLPPRSTTTTEETPVPVSSDAVVREPENQREPENEREPENQLAQPEADEYVGDEGVDGDGADGDEVGESDEDVDNEDVVVQGGLSAGDDGADYTSSTVVWECIDKMPEGTPEEQMMKANVMDYVWQQQLKQFFHNKVMVLKLVADAEAGFALRRDNIRKMRSEADLAMAQRQLDEAAMACKMSEYAAAQQAEAHTRSGKLPAIHETPMFGQLTKMRRDTDAAPVIAARKYGVWP